MAAVRVKAPAKINLTLDITGVRADGYHLVKMIMQSVSLFDEIAVTENSGSDITLSCNFNYVPLDSRNSAYKAAKAFFDAAGITNQGIHIDLKKIIPAQAGLAGGSADAAGVLMALNELYDTGYDKEKLCGIGVKVGADIPFCIYGGTMLCEGIGEILTPLPAMANCSVVIARPPKGASTPEIYKLFDNFKGTEHPDTEGCINAFTERDIKSLSKRLSNVLEPVTASLVPAVYDIKNNLLKSGADGSVMTGSGTSVYGIFTDTEKAQNAYNRLKSIYRDVFIAKPFSKGAYII